MRINDEFKSLIPPLSPEEYTQLEANILNDGCRDPLVVGVIYQQPDSGYCPDCEKNTNWSPSDGRTVCDQCDYGVAPGADHILVDGHNRLEICTKHKLKYKTDEVEFESEDEAKIWIIRNQFGRRNLAPFTRGELALKLEPLLRAKAKENLSAGGELAGRGRPKALQKSANPITPLDTRKELAKVAGLSHDTIAKIKLIDKKADDATKKELRENKISINEVAGDIRREAKRQEHAAKIESARAIRQDDLAPSGPYDLILADPPWRYDFSETENREIENHYSTATVDDIYTHKPDAKDNAVLLLWATAPKLTEALGVIEEWGFDYVTHAIWDKQKVGMGYWFRGQHELLLVGVKGKPGCTPECERVGSVFSEARGAHSKKPQCVYAWIERAFPEAKKLEMYCRSPRPGWAVWGNEVAQ